jgi:hypothetical protein
MILSARCGRCGNKVWKWSRCRWRAPNGLYYHDMCIPTWEEQEPTNIGIDDRYLHE